MKPATLTIIKTMYEKCLRSFQRFKSVFSPLVQSLNASVKCVLNLDIKFVLLSLWSLPYLYNSSSPLIRNCLCAEKRQRSGSYALGDNAAEHNRKRVFWLALGRQNRGKGLYSFLIDTNFSYSMYWLWFRHKLGGYFLIVFLFNV